MVKEWVPGVAMTSKGPRFFSESFLEGQPIWKYFALMYTLSHIYNSGASALLWSAFLQYHSCALIMLILIFGSSCNSDRLATNCLASTEVVTACKSMLISG